MAETTSVKRRSKAYWTKMDMESSGGESSDAYIPGVSAPGNRRPTRVWARRTREVKAKIPAKQPFVESLGESNVSSTTSLTSVESIHGRSLKHLRKASLKDLCPEDKQRVANLIKELARVGDEREQAVHQLHGEREHFEKQLLTLVEQQENILKEREDIQTKLFECQQLLTQYQAMIVEKQDRLNTSVAGIKEALDASSISVQTEKAATISPIPKTDEPIIESNKENVLQAAVHTKAGSNSESPSRTGNQGGGNGVGVMVPAEKGMQLSKGHHRGSSAKPVSSNHRQPERIVASQSSSDDHVTREPSVTSSDPKEGLRRPYTSLIDKEIAAERSLSRSSRDSVGTLTPRSGSVSPGHDGRPRFSYPERLSGIGPLQEPVMSSTHKSMEINAHVLDSISTKDPSRSPNSSFHGLHIRDQSPDIERAGRSGKVAFSNRRETNEDPDAKMHSPNLKGSMVLKDSEYAEYYRKMTSSERKSELLKQRQKLLVEQERLRQVLAEQELQLQRKQEEYEARQQLQKQRMEFYKEGNKFPPLNLDYGGDSEPVTKDRRKGGSPVLDENLLEVVSRATPQSPMQHQKDDDIQIHSRVLTDTSPRKEKVSMATSPIQSHDSSQDEIESVPQYVDVATSISFKSPLREIGNRQGNLPFPSNRQRSSPYKQSTSQEQEVFQGPGEKTLQVVDIVNNLDEPPVGSVDSSYNENLTPKRSREPVKYLMNNHRTSPAPSSQRKKNIYNSPANQRGASRAHPASQEDPEESREESRILEDVFFLK